MRLLIATTNPGKIAEYQALLDGLPLHIIGLHQASVDFDVAENGSTFEENALIKAQAYAKASGLLTLADDSGLCVDALDGAPGVFSARYANGDRARIERLLDQLKDVPDDQRSAQFVCVIAIAEPGGVSMEGHTFRGVCEGAIARQPSGSNGFGFDPIFYMPEHGGTMASLPTSVKNQVSHRARAALQAREWLMTQLSKP